jgi:hypothetical protein
MKLWERYQKWAVRQCSTAQCSPAFFVGIAVIALSVTIYIYREVILDALKLFGIGCGIALGCFLAYKIGTALGRTIKARRAVPSLAIDPMAEISPADLAETRSRLMDTQPIVSQAGQVTMPIHTITDAPSPAASMQGDADKLKDDTLELIWTSDGNLASRKK